MQKTLSSHLTKNLEKEVLTLATFWLLKLKDGATLGFTDADIDVVINEVTYFASTGFIPSAIMATNSLATDNMDIEGILSHDIISADDIIAGRYDYAEISVFLADYLNLNKGFLHLKTGYLGEVNISEHKFIAEVRGFAQSFNKKLGDLYSPLCRATFCDNACKANIEKYKQPSHVLTVFSKYKIACFSLKKPSSYFNLGKIKFLTGLNAGYTIEIKNYIKNDIEDEIEFILPLQNSISINDKFEIIAGCDKSFDSCINKFNNAINFRGEPHVPQIQQLL